MENLRHPNVVSLLEVSLYKNQKIVSVYMELCDGSIFDLMQATNAAAQVRVHDPTPDAGRYLSPRLILHIAVSVLQGLEYLHNQNPPIVHRDIKPENGKPLLSC